MTASAVCLVLAAGGCGRILFETVGDAGRDGAPQMDSGTRRDTGVGTPDAGLDDGVANDADVQLGDAQVGDAAPADAPADGGDASVCGMYEICSDGIDNNCDGYTDMPVPGSCGGDIAWGCDATGAWVQLTPTYHCMQRFRWTIQYRDCPDATGQDLSCTSGTLRLDFPVTGCNPLMVNYTNSPCDLPDDGGVCGGGSGSPYDFTLAAEAASCGWP